MDSTTIPVANKMESHTEEADDQTFVRANDCIHLHFIDENDSDLAVVHPTFTHQLFDDEKVFLTSPIEAHIKINLLSLVSEVNFSQGTSDEDQQLVRSKISETLTPPTTPSIQMSFPEDCLVTSFEVGGDQYSMYLVQYAHPNAPEVLSRAEKLAMWFIETASCIDFNDDKWEALFLLKNGTSLDTSTLFVGYYTLFTFHNPIKGSKMRVCQALVLPPYQGKGLGRHMLLQVYRLAAQRDFVVEVTVEDPAPGFQRLRDAVDDDAGKLTVAQQVFVSHCVEYRRLTSATTAQSTTTLGKKRAIEDVLEREGGENKAAIDGSGAMKAFRLKVKKHILSLNGDLRGLKKEVMQKELSALYAEMEQRFRSVCRKKWAWIDLVA